MKQFLQINGSIHFERICDRRRVMSKKRLAILCLGGVAPGINSVIAAVTIYGEQKGWEIIGFDGGFDSILSDNPKIVHFNKRYVRTIMNTGGSILTLSRYLPSKIGSICEKIKKLGINYLLILGGTKSLFTAHEISKYFDPSELQVLVIPKTIDNDVPLSDFQNTFGYETARQHAVKIISRLQSEVNEIPMWYFIELMGKDSGHLALSVAEAASCPLCILPEHFDSGIDLTSLCDTIEASIAKAYCNGMMGGICIISEGLIHKMRQEAFAVAFGLYPSETTPLDDANLCEAVAAEIRQRFTSRGIQMRFLSKKIGYELRGEVPVAGDLILTKRLGYGAIEGFENGQTDQVLTWKQRFHFRPISDMIDPDTGLIPPRMVDFNAEKVRLAFHFMMHLHQEDLDDQQLVSDMAEFLKLTPEEFRTRFAYAGIH